MKPFFSEGEHGYILLEMWGPVETQERRKLTVWEGCGFTSHQDNDGNIIFSDDLCTAEELNKAVEWLYSPRYDLGYVQIKGVPLNDESDKEM